MEPGKLGVEPGNEASQSHSAADQMCTLQEADLRFIGWKAANCLKVFAHIQARSYPDIYLVSKGHIPIFTWYPRVIS